MMYQARPREIAASCGRMRAWAGAGCIPDAIASQFSESERAVLAFIAFQCRQGEFAELSIKEICKATHAPARAVRNLVERASGQGLRLIEVDDRSAWGMGEGVRICDAGWLSWLTSGRWYGPADFRRVRPSSGMVTATIDDHRMQSVCRVEKARQPRRSWVLLGKSTVRG